MLQELSLAILAGAVGYFLTKMYHARMLFVERKKLGLVSNLRLYYTTRVLNLITSP